MANAKYFIDKDWLFEQYINLHKTIKEIAEIVGCSCGPIVLNLKKYNIEIQSIYQAKSEFFVGAGIELYKIRPNASEHNQFYDRNWLIDEYINKQKSAANIARDIGCKTTTVRYHLIRNNIPIRSRSETQHLSQVIEKNREKNTGELNGMYGRKHKEDAKELMRIARRNNPVKQSDERKQLLSERWKGCNNPKYGTHRFGELNPSWRGGISYGKYCKKFNDEFKEYIRNKFNRTCYICGKSEESRKLHVHHIDYNKNSICNGKSWAFVPLCQKCHLRTNHTRWYWFNLLISYWANDYWNENGI